MIVTLDMPKLSDTMSVGTIVKWLKIAGDPIARGEPFADVETDKATMPLICPEDGNLLEILAPEGSRVPIGSPVAKFQSKSTMQEGQSQPDLEVKVKITDTDAGLNPDEPPPIADSDQEEMPPPLSEEITIKVAAEASVDPDHQEEGGLDHQEEGGLDHQEEGGLEKIDSTNSSKEKEEDNPETDASKVDPAIPSLTGKSRYVYLEKEIDITSLIEAKDSINKYYSKSFADKTPLKISLNDFMVFAVSRAIVRVPEIYGFIIDGNLHNHEVINVSFSIFLSDCEVQPVIHDASSKSLFQIAKESSSLIKLAREGKRKDMDLQTPSFSICNLALSGINAFRAHPNHTAGCCLSIGSQIDKTVITNTGMFSVRKKINLNLTTDTLIADAIISAAFLNELGDLLENPVIGFLPESL